MKLKLTVKTRIMSLSGIIILFLILVMAVYHYAITSTTKSFTRLMAYEMAMARHAANTESLMYRCLGLEKDFLFRPQRGHVDALEKTLSTLNDEAGLVVGLAERAGNSEAGNSASEVIRQTDAYRGAFESVVKATEIKGFDSNSGLLGKFQGIAERLAKDLREYQVEALHIALLQMRGIEKNYIRTESEKDYRRLVESQERYGKRLDSSTAGQDVLAVMKGAAAGYGKTLKSYHAITEGTSNGSKTVLYRKIRIQARKMGKTLTGIYVPRASELLLEIRKSEKEYLLGKEKRFAGKTRDATAMLSEAFVSSKLPEEKIAAVVEEIANYRKAFDALVEKEEEVASLITVMHEASGKIIPLVRKIVATASESSEAKTIATLASVKRLAVLAICIGIIAIFGGILAASLITRGITGSVRRVLNFAGKLKTGDLSVRLPEGGDEFGEMGTALNATCHILGGMIREIKSGSRTLVSSSSELTDISGQMASNSASVADKSNTVSAASEEMSTSMNSVAAAIEQAATNISLVAGATEEMKATIGEISRNSEKARSVAVSATSYASSSSDRVDELGKAADEIGRVTEAISEISEQINLLALNATIEAARAGDAGKGFSVVAGEIKALATQTADATSEIRERVEGIQSSTRQTVGDISHITSQIKDVNGMVATIATAVEEQAAATQEISTNISQASVGMTEVTGNVSQSSMVAGEVTREIVDVNGSAGEMNSNSRQVEKSAEVLVDLSGTMEQLVDRFRL